jgi:NAD(P)-dependent dehydrogenase (short-subunit alcohol dehydrogenase family)
MMTDEFKDNNYIVIAASSGIGRCVSLELSRLGASVILIARHQGRLNKTLEQMTIGHHTAISFDVGNIEAIETTVNSIVEQYSHIDGLVFCAGCGNTYRLRDLSYSNLHELMLVNFYAFVELIRCLIKKKPKSQTMRIVGLSSLASSGNDKYFTAYNVSKAAMETTVRTLSTELVTKNTTINTIRPGWVETERILPFTELLGDMNDHIKKTGYQPQGLIPPEDVAKLVIYLLSDAAKFITGAALPINGGAVC